MAALEAIGPVDQEREALARVALVLDDRDTDERRGRLAAGR
jgi:hypothetical protein